MEQQRSEPTTGIMTPFCWKSFTDIETLKFNHFCAAAESDALAAEQHVNDADNVCPSHRSKNRSLSFVVEAAVLRSLPPPDAALPPQDPPPAPPPPRRFTSTNAAQQGKHPLSKPHPLPTFNHFLLLCLPTEREGAADAGDCGAAYRTASCCRSPSASRGPPPCGLPGQ